MKQKGNQKQVWVGIGISILCLAAIFVFIKPAEIWHVLQTARYGYVGLSVLGVFVFMLVRAVRWRFMLGQEVSWLHVFHIQNIGYMLTNILPLRIGDVARAVLIGTVPPITVAQGVSTMVVERLLDMLFIVTMLPFTLAEVAALPLWMQEAARISGILAVVAIVVLIVAANQRPLAQRITTNIFNHINKLDTDTWVTRIDNLLVGLTSLTRFRDGFVLIVLTILTWIPIVFAYYVGLVAVGIEPTVAIAGFVVCAAAFSIAAPSSPGQVGVFHAGVIGALTVLGQPDAEAASFAFLYHALNFIFLVLLGLLGVYGTGANITKVIESTRSFLGREKSSQIT
jgi:uncharacterized protein (TIRG00374 family)